LGASEAYDTTGPTTKTPGGHRQTN